jgi:hypothetical protein
MHERSELDRCRRGTGTFTSADGLFNRDGSVPAKAATSCTIGFSKLNSPAPNTPVYPSADTS